MAKKLDPKVAENVMLEAGLKPLVPYKSANTNWKCRCLNCESIVTPRYSTVYRHGAGCKTCRYAKIRLYHVLNIENVKDLVEQRGGKLITTKYKNIDSTLEFQCSKGHRFKNTFNHIKHGKQWCPTCNKGSKSEEITRTTFEQLFGYPFPKYRPVWLRNSLGNRMEIDGYCKELRIGFEYQGRQHFDLELFGNDLKKRRADDKLKKKLCSQNNLKLFIITHKMEYQDFPKYIQKQAIKLGVALPVNFSNISVDIYKAYIRNDRIVELQELLKPKKILVLSKKYLGSNKGVDLQCLICGQKWTALGNAFFNSRRVAGCDKCNRRKLKGMANKNASK